MGPFSAISGCLFIVAAIALAAAMTGNRPLLLNTTPSEPPGVYVPTGESPAVGRIIAFKTPAAAFPYAERRLAYLHHIPLLKSIAAGPRERVCVRSGRLWIGGRNLAPIVSKDGRGGTLPHWFGCRALTSDEVFVFSDRVVNSFDSRYFGPVRRSAILGVYRRLGDGRASR